MLTKIRKFFKDDVYLTPAQEVEFQEELAKFADDYCRFMLKYIAWSFYLIFFLVDIVLNREKAYLGLIIRLSALPACIILYKFSFSELARKNKYLFYTATSIVGVLIVNLLSFLVVDTHATSNYFIGFQLVTIVLFIVVQLPITHTFSLLAFLYLPHLVRITFFGGPIQNVVSDSINTLGIVSFIFAYRSFQIKVKKKDFLTRFEQKTNAVIGQNISEISHDARSPLIALQALQKGLFNEHEAKEILRITTGRLIELVENITQTASQLSVNLTSTDLNKFILQCKEYVAFLHPNNDFIWEINVTSPVWYFDSHKIKRVLINLVNNAVAATKNKKPALILIIISESSGIQFEVKDNGIGYDPNLDGSARGKSKFGSTGLGLAFVKRVANEHRGKFELVTSDNMTTAKLFIPALRK